MKAVGKCRSCGKVELTPGRWLPPFGGLKPLGDTRWKPMTCPSCADGNGQSYESFLEEKRIVDSPSGLKRAPHPNPMLYDFQSAIVRWALLRGRAAIFADCGLGKTAMQLEWCRHIPGRCLIFAPLAVGPQTVEEGAKFGIPVTYLQVDDKRTQIVVTNYERMDGFAPEDFDGIVLDESSILKSFTGKIRTKLIERWRRVPFRLCCTATPAPNDFMELGNHAEFLGVMTRAEMLSMFFVHDGGETQSWRLKGHAERDFWQWLCSFCVMLKKPSNLGFDDDGFILPAYTMYEHCVEPDTNHHGGEFLFRLSAQTLQERINARRDTIPERVEACAQLIRDDADATWLVWCNLNEESSRLAQAVPGAVEVRGSHTASHKEAAMHAFSHGQITRLVTKPSIAGFGMNWQHCHNMAFLGLSDSYEQFYQAFRRCWRFGQKHQVNVHIVISALEGAVLSNIMRKEADAQRMAREMLEHMSDICRANIGGTVRRSTAYNPHEPFNIPAFL